MDMHHLRKKSARAIAEINFSSSVCCQRGETSLSLGLESCNIQQGETNSIWPPEWVIKQQSSSPCCSSEETAIVSPYVERQLFHACLPLCFQLSQDLDRQKRDGGWKAGRGRAGDKETLRSMSRRGVQKLCFLNQTIKCSQLKGTHFTLMQHLFFPKGHLCQAFLCQKYIFVCDPLSDRYLTNFCLFFPFYCIEQFNKFILYIYIVISYFYILGYFCCICWI